MSAIKASKGEKKESEKRGKGKVGIDRKKKKKGGGAGCDVSWRRGGDRWWCVEID